MRLRDVAGMLLAAAFYVVVIGLTLR